MLVACEGKYKGVSTMKKFELIAGGLVWFAAWVFIFVMLFEGL